MTGPEWVLLALVTVAYVAALGPGTNTRNPRRRLYGNLVAGLALCATVVWGLVLTGG